MEFRLSAFLPTIQSPSISRTPIPLSANSLICSIQLTSSFAMLESRPSKSARNKSMGTNSPSRPSTHSLTSPLMSMSPTTCSLIMAKEPLWEFLPMIHAMPPLRTDSISPRFPFSQTLPPRLSATAVPSPASPSPKRQSDCFFRRSRRAGALRQRSIGFATGW